MLTELLPHKLVAAAILRRRFMQFAHSHGLVYFGLLLPSDDYEPVRGFTRSTSERDDHVMHGSIHGREVTMLQRTVTHSHVGRSRHTRSQSWLILSIRHDNPSSPHLLLLSHEHPRLHDEAVAIHHSKASHISLEHRLDAKFLIYGKPSAAQDFKANSNYDFIDRILKCPEYDYEIDSDTIYIYSHVSSPTASELTNFLASGLSLVDAYEKSPV